MNEVLTYLLKNSGPLVQPEDLAQLLSMSQYQWQNYADQLKGIHMYNSLHFFLFVLVSVCAGCMKFYVT